MFIRLAKKVFTYEHTNTIALGRCNCVDDTPPRPLENMIETCKVRSLKYYGIGLAKMVETDLCDHLCQCVSEDEVPSEMSYRDSNGVDASLGEPLPVVLFHPFIPMMLKNLLCIRAPRDVVIALSWVGRIPVGPIGDPTF